MQQSSRHTAAAIVATLLILAGCTTDGGSRAAQGAGAGAAIGAGLGLLIGALGGKPERGLLVGAAMGASRGAYEGWRQDQEDARTAQITSAIRASSDRSSDSAPDTRAREELTRLLGSWTVEGWLDPGAGNHLTVTGTARGHVEMNYFVELAYIDLAVEGYEGEQIWGSSTFGYDERDGYAMSTRFNTLPEPIRLNGSFSGTTRTFDFEDREGRVSIRFENPDRFHVETTVGGKLVESYRFTRT